MLLSSHSALLPLNWSNDDATFAMANHCARCATAVPRDSRLSACVTVIHHRAEVLGMEKEMLRVLRFELSQPTMYSFAARYCKAAGIFGITKVSGLPTVLYCKLLQ